jgi:FixJ family two-component response regulator
MSNERTTLHVLDTDSARRARLARLAFSAGFHAEIYADREELLSHAPDHGIVLAHDEPDGRGVVGLVNEMMLRARWLPVIAFSEEPVTQQVVRAVKGGALDYLVLPIADEALRQAVDRARREAEVHRGQRERAVAARQRIATLSQREREVLDRLAAGCSNKVIARELAISPRTVEIHRMKMMGKLGARHAAEAVRLRIEADSAGEIAA